jgi:hypothetical protein
MRLQNEGAPPASGAPEMQIPAAPSQSVWATATPRLANNSRFLKGLDVPRAANNEAEYRAVYNLDLDGLSPLELLTEMQRTVRIVDRDPGRFLWRGLDFISARQWGHERIALCRELLLPAQVPLEGGDAPSPVVHVAHEGSTTPFSKRRGLKGRIKAWT